MLTIPYAHDLADFWDKKKYDDFDLVWSALMEHVGYRTRNTWVGLKTKQKAAFWKSSLETLGYKCEVTNEKEEAPKAPWRLHIKW